MSEPPQTPTTALALVAVIGCGAMGGVFFTFSSFVMPALKRLRPSAGIEAMQSINVTAVRAPFMIALFGTALICLVIAVLSVRDLGDRRSALMFAGSALYLLGAIVLTAVHHVPLNDALAKVDPHAAGAAADWKHYLDRWVPLNHVRAAASLAAAAAFLAGIRA
jgi:uncharacterized membrane protein